MTFWDRHLQSHRNESTKCSPFPGRITKHPFSIYYCDISKGRNVNAREYLAQIIAVRFPMGGYNPVRDFQLQNFPIKFLSSKSVHRKLKKYLYFRFFLTGNIPSRFCHYWHACSCLFKRLKKFLAVVSGRTDKVTVFIPIHSKRTSIFKIAYFNVDSLLNLFMSG